MRLRNYFLVVVLTVVVGGMLLETTATTNTKLLAAGFYLGAVLLSLFWTYSSISGALTALSESAIKARSGISRFTSVTKGPLEVQILSQHAIDFVVSFENEINQNNALFNAIPDTLFTYTRNEGFKRIKTDSASSESLSGVLTSGWSLAELLSEDQLKSVLIHVNNCLDTGELKQFEVVLTFGDNSHYFEARATAINKDQAVIVVRDLTTKRAAENKIQHMAFHDDLTGLLNRSAFKERVGEFANSEADLPYCLLFIDVDKFKTVNDEHGHDVGDRMLRHIACCLEEHLRFSDTITRNVSSRPINLPARIGGDEFMILLPEMNKHKGVANIIERLLSAISKPFLVNGKQVSSSVSIGVAYYPDDGVIIDEIINHADLAMFEAKKKGGNTYTEYDKSMGELNRRKITLESKLRKAIEQDELFLVYQPKIDLKTHKVIGAEALVRWKDGDRIISPLEFIPIAEESGLILPLGDKVLSMAVNQLSIWNKDGNEIKHIAVNVAASQFKEAHFRKSLINIMDQAKLDYSMLNIEITESMFVHEFDHAVKTLCELQAMGFTIAMDDFGTGYSSLSYLTQMPLDILKIDRSFVSGMMRDSRQMAIVETIIQLGRTLNLKIVAEGVETAEQLVMLKKMDCDEAQGYFFSPPVEAELFERFCSKACFSNFNSKESDASGLSDLYPIENLKTHKRQGPEQPTIH